MTIYIAKNGVKAGPFTEEQLHGMVMAGLVSVDDLAWCDGTVNWRPLGTMLGISQPPPLPAIPPEPVALDAAATPVPIGPKGVGGWLLFFCVSLTIIYPLVTLGLMANSWKTSKQIFERFPYWETMSKGMLYEYAIYSGILIYGFRVGYKIWRGSPQGRNLAYDYLFVRLFWSLVAKIWAFYNCFGYGMPEPLVRENIDSAVAGGISEIAYFVLWMAYLKRSKRVKATYTSPRPELWYMTPGSLKHPED